jgi:antitoxin HicB
MKYAMIIAWSDEDQAYVVSVPEWDERVCQPVTDGSTYTEAAQRGQAVLEALIALAHQHGEPLPVPKTHAAA